MRWNSWYVGRSYLRSALWIVPLVSLFLEQVAIRMVGALAGCGKTPCPNRHRFDSVLAYCGDVANDAWQGP